MTNEKNQNESNRFHQIDMVELYVCTDAGRNGRGNWHGAFISIELDDTRANVSSYIYKFRLFYALLEPCFTFAVLVVMSDAT